MRRFYWMGVLLVFVATSIAANGASAADEPSSPAPAKPQAAVPAAPTVRDFGAVGDGQADDTAAIQKAVDSGVGDVRFPRGVYRITQPIVVDLDRVGPTALVASGAARLLMAGPGPAIRFVGTHGGTADPGSVKPNVWERQRMPTVDGLEIIGAHEEAVGIEAAGTMQLVVSRVNVREALHGVHLVTRNRNVIVADCHLYQNRGAGLYLDDVDLHQINVSNSHVSYNAAGGIVVRAGNVRNLQVTGCDIEANMPLDADASQEAPPTANVLIDCTGGKGGTAEVAITGCTIQHSHAARDSANIRFIGCDFDDRRWGHLVISGNVMSDVQINVDIQLARGVSIVGNTFWKGVQHNLRIVGSTNVVVGPNVMDRNPRYQDQADADDGVLVRDCRDCTITGLHVNGARRKPGGLILENCRRMNVTGCTLLDCDNAGLLLKDVTESRVSDCLISNELPDAESWVPLKVIGGGENTIVDNGVGEN
ncbi:MAG TPA: right-handed parallel beta-helix repeat-containing protein [Thermoguttaceae bacterium]|nr:right-handed parallel beta-helix repeat-containing protein [Thermoguttaceae bacterium]